LFWCFGCRTSANLPELIEKFGYTYFEALRLIGEDDYDIEKEVNRILAEDKEPEPFDQAVLDRLHDSVWGTGQEYFNGRNISDDSIVKFRLGYSDKRQMVIVPVYSPRGTPWGFVARTIVGKRFQNSAGLVRSHTLFNLNNIWTEPRVFVVESTFDAIRLDQVGIPAVATMGATISNTQIDLLIRTFDDIVVLPDNDGEDGAGSKMVRKIRRLIPYAQIVQLEGVHDVGDMSDEELQELL
jgi:DNA primase